MSHIRIDEKTKERLLRMMGVLQSFSTKNISMVDVINSLLDEVEPKYEDILNTITKMVKVEGE